MLVVFLYIFRWITKVTNSSILNLALIQLGFLSTYNISCETQSCALLFNHICFSNNSTIIVNYYILWNNNIIMINGLVELEFSY